jgi:hypothetical protein
MLQIEVMTTALHRKLESLRRLAERPGTEGEGIAAEEAIQRILAKLGDDAERLVDTPEPYVARQPKRSRRERRAYQSRIHIGDIIDVHGTEGVFSWCRCGSSRFEVCEGIAGVAVALLVCCRCKRNRKLHREHFEPGGRHL